jgi:hypothetical protein
MAQGTQDFTPDPRNENILINVNGVLTPRAQAVVSVFDSGFMLGDAVWNSQGFGAPTAPSVLTNDDQQRIADDCRASYEALVRYCV